MGLIYMFTSPSGKKYIGQTINTFSLRKSKHLSEAMRPSNKKTCSPYFHAAIRKYGLDSFKEEILLEIHNELLDENEARFIREHNSLYPNGYNMKEGGRSNHKVSDESRKRMSESKKLLMKNNPEAYRELAMNNALKSTRSTFLPMFVSEVRDENNMHIGYKVSRHPKSPETKLFVENDLKSSYNKAIECYKYLQNIVDGVPKPSTKKRQESTMNLPKYVVEVKHRKTKVIIGYGVNGHQIGGKRKDFVGNNMQQNLDNAKAYLEQQLIEIKAQRLNGSG